MMMRGKSSFFRLFSYHTLTGRRPQARLDHLLAPFRRRDAGEDHLGVHAHIADIGMLRPALAAAQEPAHRDAEQVGYWHS